MRRLLRILLNAATAVSLVLCVTTASVWVWSHWQFTLVRWEVLDGRAVSLVAERGRVGRPGGLPTDNEPERQSATGERQGDEHDEATR